jgi:hypothetical protein
VSDSEPCCINIYVYSILVLFALVIFYDLYIAYFCIYQDFIVKKLISSRYSLNSPEFDEKYLKYLPRILYNDDELLYNEAPKPAKDKTPELPTENELIEAARYVRENSLPCFLMNNQAIEKGPLINDLNKNQGNGNSNNQKLKMLECQENSLNSPQQVQSIRNSSDKKEVMIYVNNNK